jgi:hypothetical protein
MLWKNPSAITGHQVLFLVNKAGDLVIVDGLNGNVLINHSNPEVACRHVL